MYDPVVSFQAKLNCPQKIMFIDFCILACILYLSMYFVFELISHTNTYVEVYKKEDIQRLCLVWDQLICSASYIIFIVVKK